MLYVVLHIYIYNITARPWGLPGLATSVRASQDDDDDDDDDDDGDDDDDDDDDDEDDDDDDVYMCVIICVYIYTI